MPSHTPRERFKKRMKNIEKARKKRSSKKKRSRPRVQPKSK